MKVPLVIVSNNRLGNNLNVLLHSSPIDGELGLYAQREFPLLTLLKLAKDHLTNQPIVNTALDLTTTQSITGLTGPHHPEAANSRSSVGSSCSEMQNSQ